jgi:hypothetical protein
MGELTWLYRLVRRSVGPNHQTAWIAVQTVATLLAFVAASWYVRLTQLLWRETQRTNQANLMQQLMVEYDGLRDSVITIQEWYRESASAGVDPLQRFDEATAVDDVDYAVERVDDARFRVSRFFVKIRKLSLAGFLERRIIVLALNRAPMADVFLSLVDPLDQVISARVYGRTNVTDREFFGGLIRDFETLSS